MSIPPDWWHEQTNENVTENSKSIAILAVKLDSLTERVTDQGSKIDNTYSLLNEINTSLWLFKWLARVAGVCVGLGLALTGKIAFSDVTNFGKLFK